MATPHNRNAINMRDDLPTPTHITHIIDMRDDLPNALMSQAASICVMPYPPPPTPSPLDMRDALPSTSNQMPNRHARRPAQAVR